MKPAFLFFHLNLAYSSIAPAQRAEVIERCYWPLLALARERGVKLGIELSGWTLERIDEIAPDWVVAFRQLLDQGRCELLGSGYVQMIGPLAPAGVNRWNQAYGLACYEGILGHRPRLALVNEMAYAAGLVPIYQQAGYEGIIMDGDNVCLALGLDDSSRLPGRADGGAGRSLPVLWSDSILFQKVQRYCHGDIPLADYLHHFRLWSRRHRRPAPVYSNDAEVFDYRPGRFAEEAVIHPEGEWRRLGRLLDTLVREEGVSWLLPGEALARQRVEEDAVARSLSSIREPIPVKKQAKYNVGRWAVSGRDDLRLNTLCQRLFRAMEPRGEEVDETARRQLLQLWASDLRTHIGSERWQAALRQIEALAGRLGVSTALVTALEPLQEEADEAALAAAGFRLQRQQEGIILQLETDEISLRLNLRRGLTTERLAFADHGFEVLVGTLPHGYFHSIELGADFYSNGVVVELIKAHRRVTDLERVTPRFFLEDGNLHIRAGIETPLGRIEKEVVVPPRGQRLEFATAFPHWQRPYGTLRLGTVTLLPEGMGDDLTLRCHCGGVAPEQFTLDQPCDHTRPASALVSTTSGLGGAGGEVVIRGRHALAIHWDPGQAAAFPMLLHRPCAPAALTRLTFSLVELDETFREGGILPAFRYSLAPAGR